MRRNYIKIALRMLRRQPGYSLISIVGLAVGMMCCMLLLLYVHDELRYDRSYEKADRVFRVVTDVIDDSGTVNATTYSYPALGPAMLRGMPTVEAVTRVDAVESSLIRVGEKHFTADRRLIVDSSFFDVFSYRFLQGDSKTALNKPYTVVLTRSTAQRYFGEANPVGQTINLNNRDDLQVTAVIEDPPTNTHVRFDVLTPMETFNAERPGFFDNAWGVLYGYTYVLLADAAQAGAVAAGLPALTNAPLQALRERGGYSIHFALQPLTRIHLHSHRENELEPGGQAAYVYLLATIAALVLLIACINFVNLATARATARAREVGVRKVVGASRSELIRQFLIESMLSATLAAVLAQLLFVLLLPVFNQLSGKAFTVSVLGTPVLFAGFIAVVLIAGLAGGGYPAFVLSAFRPALVLKGLQVHGRSGAGVRKGLVVVEFTGAIVLMIGAGVIVQQLSYMRNADLGFDKAQVIALEHVFPRSRAGQMEAVKQALVQVPAVKAVTLASEWPTRPVVGQLPFRTEGMPVGEGRRMEWYQVDEAYLETLGMTLAAGRNFSPERTSDSAAVLITQTAARHLGLADDEAVGTRLFASVRDDEAATIIGVVKDFHTRSLHDPVAPVLFAYYWARPRNILVKIDGRDIPATLARIEETWAQHLPGFPLTYIFIDQQYDALYRAEERLSHVINTFAGLAMFVACLGLFGLAAFSAGRRMKEVGIRKVLGATVAGLVVLLSRDFLRLVAIAFVISAPLAYLAMEVWLNNFAYRVDISWGVFLVVGLTVLGIALVAVGYQAVRTALSDPVKALRYE